MDTHGPPNWPHYQLTRGLIGLDNKKDGMTSLLTGRKYDAPPGECTVLYLVVSKILSPGWGVRAFRPMAF